MTNVSCFTVMCREKLFMAKHTKAASQRSLLFTLTMFCSSSRHQYDIHCASPISIGNSIATLIGHGYMSVLLCVLEVLSTSEGDMHRLSKDCVPAGETGGSATCLPQKLLPLCSLQHKTQVILICSTFPKTCFCQKILITSLILFSGLSLDHKKI